MTDECQHRVDHTFRAYNNAPAPPTPTPTFDEQMAAWGRSLNDCGEGVVTLDYCEPLTHIESPTVLAYAGRWNRGIDHTLSLVHPGMAEIVRHELYEQDPTRFPTDTP